MKFSRSFIDCCSLSELLSQLATTEVMEVTSTSSTPSGELGPALIETGNTSSQLDILEQRPAETITLTLKKEGHAFDRLGKSFADSTNILVVKIQINISQGKSK